MYNSVLIGPSPPKGLQQFAWLWTIQPDIGEARRDGAGKTSRGLGAGMASAGTGNISAEEDDPLSSGSWARAVHKPTAVSKMANGKLAFALMLAS